uniref:Uncharacterized protein n=1 Tax=Oryza punctata TaxID=4537 RepID=A0A0E0L136_ORYPU
MLIILLQFAKDEIKLGASHLTQVLLARDTRNTAESVKCWKHSHLIWLGSTGLLRIYDPGTSTEWKQTSG